MALAADDCRTALAVLSDLADATAARLTALSGTAFSLCSRHDDDVVRDAPDAVRQLTTECRILAADLVARSNAVAQSITERKRPCPPF